MVTADPITIPRCCSPSLTCLPIPKGLAPHFQIAPQPSMLRSICPYTAEPTPPQCSCVLSPPADFLTADSLPTTCLCLPLLPGNRLPSLASDPHHRSRSCPQAACLLSQVKPPPHLQTPSPAWPRTTWPGSDPRPGALVLHLLLPCCLLFLLNPPTPVLKVYLFILREREWGGGRERLPSRLCAVSAEPDVGLNRITMKS